MPAKATKQHVAIFTTASLPWMTGTSVNPLFRAAYLAKRGDRHVTLVIPWLSRSDQELVYPNNIAFSSPLDQEDYIRKWLLARIEFTPQFSIRFYPGKYSKLMRSIISVGDLTEQIPDEEAEVAVLEEPEHLNWYHHGGRWRSKFQRVIGVVHTNYLEYVRREKHGKLLAVLLRYANTWVTRIYCHRVIRLSGATQDFPRSVICNVHGVNPKFLEVGKAKLAQLQRGEAAFTKGAYYIGKMVWNKGYRELLQLLSEHQAELYGFQIDLYGSGEDSDEIREAAEKLSIKVKVYPGRDHTDPVFHEYKVFLNPSTTDVVCTTTAEALAMGKIVICADHPSNEFFKQFPNGHVYDSSSEFVKITMDSLTEEPSPLSDELRHELSWEAATNRFIEAAELDTFVPENVPTLSSTLLSSTLQTPALKRHLEDASIYVHQALSSTMVARRALDAIPLTSEDDKQLRKELGLDVSLPASKRRLVLWQ